MIVHGGPGALLSHTHVPIHAIVTIWQRESRCCPHRSVDGLTDLRARSGNHGTKYRLGYCGIERIRIRVGVGKIRKVWLRIGAGEWAGIGYDVRRFAREAAGEKAIMRKRGYGQGDAIDEHIRGKARALRSVARGLANLALGDGQAPELAMEQAAEQDGAAGQEKAMGLQHRRVVR
jgi:hypothetical protein